MLKTRIEFCNGKPFISVDGKVYPPLAYTTYFEECGTFSDFIKFGYRMFFINVSFTDLPINNVTGFSPFRTGVFEGDVPDYSEFDSVVREILAECPDALIFPRINIAMPRKWLEKHPFETVKTKTGNRESLYSDVFLHDGAELLKILLSHIRSSDYSDRIAGYQLCGGTTQEWMHHDLSGSVSHRGIQKFRLWAEQKYAIKNMNTFFEKDLKKGHLIHFYGEFCCEMAAKTVEHFCKATKEYINSEQIVGVFYGYNAFVNDYLLGLHGLRLVIDSPYIDFFSSPCCYDDNRNLGVDWGDMLPAESVKRHGKLYFVECDVRTYLTERMQISRPGRYPDDIYNLEDEHGNKTVWCGLETPELSISAIRKTFAHQISKGSGIWWFDMWGGWFQDQTIMAEMKKMKEVSEYAKEKNADLYPSAQTVMFIDEKAYFNNPIGSDFCHSVNRTRVAMGNTGIPFDLCMVEDAEKVLSKYKAAIFTAPFPSETGKNAVRICEKLKIPYIQSTPKKSFYSKAELRDFFVKSGVHCYNDGDSVVYCGNGFLGVHAANGGEIKIKLPGNYRIKPILGADTVECETEFLCLDMDKHETVVFELI